MKAPIPLSQYLNRDVMYWSELHKVFEVTDSNSTGQETRVRATDQFIIRAPAWTIVIAGPHLDETESAQQAREQEASSGQRTYTMLHSLTTLAPNHPKLITELVFDRVDMLSPRMVAETGLADFPALQRVHFLYCRESSNRILAQVNRPCTMFSYLFAWAEASRYQKAPFNELFVNNIKTDPQFQRTWRHGSVLGNRKLHGPIKILSLDHARPIKH